MLQRRTHVTLTHVYLPAQEYTPFSFYSTLINHGRFGKISFKIQLTHKNLIVLLAGTTSYCVFFIQCPPIYTSQPKCYEMVLYTDDGQLLYPIDSFMRPVYQLPAVHNIFIDINYTTIKTLSLSMYVCKPLFTKYY